MHCVLCMPHTFKISRYSGKHGPRNILEGECLRRICRLLAVYENLELRISFSSNVGQSRTDCNT